MAEATPNSNIDGMGYEKGKRDFSSNDDAARVKRLKYDFESDTKEYTNGIVAKNKTRKIIGQLTGKEILIPDINSGYPKCKIAPIGNWESKEEETLLDLKDHGFKDVLSHLRKFMIVVPSTNTTVEQDFWRLLHSNPNLDGVGLHSSPILISSPKLASDGDMLEFLVQFRREIMQTIDIGMTAEPEYIVMGMSLETFFGGVVGNREFIEQIGDRCGLSVATGAEACEAALKKLNAKKIAIITPYQDIGDRNCVKFFEEIGCEVVAVHGLKCGSATDIAHVPEEVVEPILRNLAARPGVEAVVQCGTNLSLIRTMDKLEKELGVAMVPINAATLWFALRENGINEPMYNACKLCRDF